MHTYPTSTSRSNQINILQPKHVRTENSKRLVSFQIPSLINTLPHILIRKVHTHSFDGFNTYAKKYLLSRGVLQGGGSGGLSPPSKILLISGELLGGLLGRLIMIILPFWGPTGSQIGPK